MPELKPCPFCGGEAELIWNAIGGFAGCFNEDCPVGPSTSTFAVGDEWESEAEAEPHIIDAWNTRVERTCRAEYHDCGDGVGGWYCSECGDLMDAGEFNDCDYCPNCGARVIKE